MSFYFQFLVLLVPILTISIGNTVSEGQRDQDQAVTRENVDQASLWFSGFNNNVREASFNNAVVTRKKRSLGLIASLFNRMMYNEVQDSMEQDNVADDDTIDLVKCELVIKSKTCTTRETKTVCKNYFDRQCFLYTYPRVTTTVEKKK